MSTKIWVAYRLLKNKNLWDVAHDIRLKATENARKVFRSLYKNQLVDLDDSNLPFQVYLRKTKHSGPVSLADRMLFLHTQMREAYLKQLVQPFRSEYEFDAWVWFRQYKGVIILQPRAEALMAGIFNFMKNDHRLVDWHYQNQVSPDPAELADPKDWKRRKKFYEGIDSSGRWLSYLMLSICDKDTINDVDPWLEIIAEERKNK